MLTMIGKKLIRKAVSTAGPTPMPNQTTRMGTKAAIVTRKVRQAWPRLVPRCSRVCSAMREASDTWRALSARRPASNSGAPIFLPERPAGVLL